MPHITAPQIVFGYHGCTEETADKILSGELQDLSPSDGEDEWLGGGIYFWENAPARAAEWAVEWSARNAAETGHASGGSARPAVLGVMIDLGRCLNLLDVSGHEVLKRAAEGIAGKIHSSEARLPETERDRHKWDCLAINAVNDNPAAFLAGREYDTIRGCFPEGRPVTRHSAIRSKTHVQICVRNPECIVGYFRPKNVADLIRLARPRLLERCDEEFRQIGDAMNAELDDVQRMADEINGVLPDGAARPEWLNRYVAEQVKALKGKAETLRNRILRKKECLLRIFREFP